jgi:hypothetical protein
VTSTTLVLSLVSVATQAAGSQLEVLCSYLLKVEQHTREDGGWEGDNLRLGDLSSVGNVLGLSLLDNSALSDCGY